MAPRPRHSRLVDLLGAEVLDAVAQRGGLLELELLRRQLYLLLELGDRLRERSRVGNVDLAQLRRQETLVVLVEVGELQQRARDVLDDAPRFDPALPVVCLLLGAAAVDFVDRLGVYFLSSSLPTASKRPQNKPCSSALPAAAPGGIM